MTTDIATVPVRMGFGNSYFKMWLVRDAANPQQGYVTGGRYKGHVTECLGRGTRQHPPAAHPRIASIVLKRYIPQIDLKLMLVMI